MQKMIYLRDAYKTELIPETLEDYLSLEDHFHPVKPSPGIAVPNLCFPRNSMEYIFGLKKHLHAETK